MRLHLRELRIHLSYYEWALCTRVAVIQGMNTTLTGSGAQRPLWQYEDFFSQGIKAKVRGNGGHAAAQGARTVEQLWLTSPAKLACKFLSAPAKMIFNLHLVGWRVLI